MQNLKEQLRQAEEQLQATRQQAAMLGSELRDASSGRDLTMAELYHARQEADALRSSLAEAQEECRKAQSQLDKLKSQTPQKTVSSPMFMEQAWDMVPCIISTVNSFDSIAKHLKVC